MADRARIKLGRVAMLALGLACFAAAADASATRPLTTGFADIAFVSHDEERRDQALDYAAEVGAGIARLPIFWDSLTRGQPADPANPADPAYDFSALDDAVTAASRRGLEVMMTVTNAPGFAEGADRPPLTVAGSWKPSPVALAQFARALATRYSGAHPGPGGPLPRVRLYQAWNEPNLETYLSPQYEHGVPVASAHYREMLNAFYDAVKAVHADNQVVTAGTAPYGDQPGAGRTRPLAFWRDVLCLSRRLNALSCPTKARFDVLAHHPINTSGGPRIKARHPDDASTRDFGEVVELLRAGERRETLGTGGRHQAWATEIWWETDPPDDFQGVSLRRHARWLAQAQYLLWRQRAKVVIGYPVIDLPHEPNAPFAPTSSGIRFVDGAEKPAVSAFEFPVVVDRKRRGMGVVWGRAPQDGRLKLQRRSRGRWRKFDAFRVEARATFKSTVQLRRTKAVRARLGDEVSLSWRLR